MKHPSLSHPSTEQLIAFARGVVDAASRDELERHIAQCWKCCEALRQVPDDTLLGRLKTSDTASELHLQLDSPERPSAKAHFAEVPPELADHPRYRIIKPLGYGGMGVVYQAEHRMMERPVAIKVISRSLMNKSSAVERFRIEVKAAARLAHPNIVAAHDADQAGDLHFLVMEYVEGQSLARHIEKRGPMTVADACNCIKQAAAGLQHAHERGMVHRDIKPQNLMLTKKGFIKILDFGLARFARESEPAATLAATDLPPDSGALTSLGMVLGTPDYIAPEQTTDSHQADIRADIYSLGCTLYFLLTGRPPYPQGSVLDKLAWHRDGTPRPIDQARGDVPADVMQVLEKMMAKDPQRRYQTPSEVVQALSGLTKTVSPPPIQVPHPSPAAAPHAPRRPVLAETVDMNFAAQRTPPVVATNSLMQKLNPLDGFDLPARAAPAVAWRQGDWSPPRRKRRLPKVSMPVVASLGGVVVTAVLAGLIYSAVNREPTSPPDPPQAAGLAPPRPQWSPTPIPAAGKRVLFVLPSHNFYYPDYRPVRDALERGGVKVKVASNTSKPAQPDARADGVPVVPDILLDQVQVADYDAIVFGGGWGIKMFQTGGPSHDVARDLIRKMLAEGKLVAAICNGPTVLADAGVLDGKQATSFHEAEWRLKKSGVNWVNEPFVVSGQIITGRGPGDVDEFSRALLRKLGVDR